MFGSSSLPQIVSRLDSAENEEDFQSAFSGLKRS